MRRWPQQTAHESFGLNSSRSGRASDGARAELRAEVSVRLGLGDEHSGPGARAADQPDSAIMADPIAHFGICRELDDLDPDSSGELEQDDPRPAPRSPRALAL